MTETLSRERLVEEKKKIALLSVLLNLFLSVLKIVIGFVSGSASLIADGVHSLADLAAAMSVFAGIVIANMKSESFPYGLYKVENLISLASAFAIFFAGYEIARDVLFENEIKHITNLPLALSAVIITIVATFLFSRWERKKGEELNSPSLIADAEHVKTDMLSSIVVLVGILGNYFGYPWIEKLAVLIIVVLIFHAGWEITVEALKVLLDATVDKETLEEIEGIIRKNPFVEEVKNLTGRSSGSYKFIEAEIVLRTKDFEKAHEVVHSIEEEVKKRVPFIERILIHFEPPEEREKVYALLVDREGNLCVEPKRCEKAILLKASKKGVEELKVIEIVEEFGERRGVAAEFIERLAEEKVDCVVVGKLFFGRGALYAMAFYGMEFAEVKGDLDTAKRLIGEKNGELCRSVYSILGKG
jgi:cation diffusion facilitator family transporter